MDIKYEAFTDEIQKQADVGGIVRHGARGLRSLFEGISSGLKTTQEGLGRAYKSSQQAAKTTKYRIGMEARLGFSKSPIGKKVRGADVRRLAQQRVRGEAPSTRGMDLNQGERVELRRVLGFDTPRGKKTTGRPVPKQPSTGPKATSKGRPKGEQAGPTPKSSANTRGADVADMPSGNGVPPTQKSLSIATKIGLGAGAAGLSAGGAYYYTKKKQHPKPVGYAYRR